MRAYLPVFCAVLLLAVSVAAKIGLVQAQGGAGYEEKVLYGRTDEEAVERYVQSYGMYLPGGEFARRMLAFMGGLSSDIYWLKAAQYVSRHFRNPEMKPLFLSELYEAMLDADPYWYSAAVVAARILDAVSKQHVEAEALLLKALRHRPEQWQLWFELGGIYLFWTGHEGDAARAYRRAAELPGAPKLLLDVAATLYSEAGRHEMARTVTQQRIERYRNLYGVDSNLVKIAERDLQEFEARYFEEVLNRAVKEFVRRKGRLPERLRELRQEGLAGKEAMQDPFGQGWLINPDTGQIKSKGLGILEGYRMKSILSGWIRAYRKATERFPDNLAEAVAFQRTKSHGAEVKRLFGKPPVLKSHPLLGKWDYDPETGKIRVPEGYRYDDLYPSNGESPSEESASPAT